MAGNALYDLGLRLRAAELYDMGRGRASIAALLGIPEETVRKWLDIYRSAGIEVDRVPNVGVRGRFPGRRNQEAVIA